MALTESIEYDKIEIVTPYKHVQVRKATVIKKDGTEVIAKGEELSLEALLGMDWYIQGVDVIGLKSQD